MWVALVVNVIKGKKKASAFYVRAIAGFPIRNATVLAVSYQKSNGCRYTFVIAQGYPVAPTLGIQFYRKSLQ